MTSKEDNQDALSADKNVIRVGTRESALAMAQTEEVVRKLKKSHQHITFKVGIVRSFYTIKSSIYHIWNNLIKIQIYDYRLNKHF